VIDARAPKGGSRAAGVDTEGRAGEKFRKAVQDQGDYWFKAGVLTSKPDLSKQSTLR
jgi:hypothetical protein